MDTAFFLYIWTLPWLPTSILFRNAKILKQWQRLDWSFLFCNYWGVYMPQRLSFWFWFCLDWIQSVTIITFWLKQKQLLWSDLIQIWRFILHEFGSSLLKCHLQIFQFHISTRWYCKSINDVSGKLGKLKTFFAVARDSVLHKRP